MCPAASCSATRPLQSKTHSALAHDEANVTKLTCPANSTADSLQHPSQLHQSAPPVSCTSQLQVMKKTQTRWWRQDEQPRGRRAVTLVPLCAEQQPISSNQVTNHSSGTPIREHRESWEFQLEELIGLSVRQLLLRPLLSHTLTDSHTVGY